MPDQIRQSCITGVVEDKVMHADFEEAWTEREEARKAVLGRRLCLSRVAEGTQKT